MTHSVVINVMIEYFSTYFRSLRIWLQLHFSGPKESVLMLLWQWFKNYFISNFLKIICLKHFLNRQTHQKQILKYKWQKLVPCLNLVCEKCFLAKQKCHHFFLLRKRTKLRLCYKCFAQPSRLLWSPWVNPIQLIIT